MSETPRLLLVEDEEHLAFTLALNLRAEGFEVATAPTAAEARRRLAERWDVVVLDRMLPDGNGLELCEELRAARDRTPVLMLTARGTPEDVVGGLDAGADDYLTKPFALAELMSRLQALLRRRRWERPSEPEAASLLTFGGAQVDFDTHEVRVRGDRVELTELELRLLRFFAENELRVVSRGELLESVWGVSAEARTRTVDNFIVRLRRVFEEDPANPVHFLTIRGVGYQFRRDA